MLPTAHWGFELSELSSAHPKLPNSLLRFLINFEKKMLETSQNIISLLESSAVLYFEQSSE